MPDYSLIVRRTRHGGTSAGCSPTANVEFPPQRLTSPCLHSEVTSKLANQGGLSAANATC